MPDKEAIGLDPFAIGALIDELVGRGIPRELLLGVRQGSALSPAVWTVERKLKDGTMRHSDQDAVGWSVGNAVAEQRGNAVLITKQTAGKAKIDPLIALLNAATLMAKNPQAQDTTSVYEDRGILVL
jgi:phage terminase large subunit-like protein